MRAPQHGYSAKFQEHAKAEEYERFYQHGKADEAMWRIERDFLDDLLRRDGRDWLRCSYLDFACGAGRVIAFLESRVGESRGIDISPEMLQIAAGKVRRSHLLQIDITASETPESTYDLITAFRFFLNAEPSLRRAVMKALTRRLKDGRSLLVFTNHGNPLSYKAVLWPYHQLRRRGGKRPVVGNYMTHWQVMELVERAGLELVEHYGYGFVSPKLFRLAPAISWHVERWSALQPVINRFGVNQVYVARLAST